MLNDIVQKENAPKQLERLAAQRYLYSRAKKVLVIQVSLDLSTPIISAIIVAFVPGFDIYAAFIGIAIALLDVSLETYQSSRKRQAADIQEIFDCDVLGLECQELKKRRRPLSETIMEAAKKYRRKEPNYASLHDWYPPIVQNLPLYLARIVCQRINCWWDAQLRRRYLNGVGIVLLALCFVVFLVGLINGLTLGKFFLAIVIPLVPSFLWGFREYRGQREAAKEKDELRKYAEELWDKALNKELVEQRLTEESRTLQDEIYNNRRTNPFILDIFYRFLRKKDEEFMNRRAEELVNDALQSLSTNNP